MGINFLGLYQGGRGGATASDRRGLAGRGVSFPLPWADTGRHGQIRVPGCWWRMLAHRGQIQ
ncbi:hypothetical protein DGI_1612 [Megalodesulfovibrio gigas DSM 1382 = ATCC 19364]|uniref:Uncharacterized protein n=1 Tax=Megalodesulfovibrio gigas (strain ATCC 19364 / DSM 1382 / NCIMB 9332 / VKM B-1759) TaxID=1121448 RepID=T2GBD2_MEGG1|nr:hypothetical protein DGI_1612 [Megalodesulfovibrio gigas DSM 1382 = ATCC 19364]